MSFARLIADLTSSTSVPAIEHEHLQEACLAGDCHVIDVREPGEYEAGHIPNAINHPLSRFDPAQLPTDKPLVLVCQAGGRSARGDRNRPKGCCPLRGRNGRLARARRPDSDVTGAIAV